MGGEGRVASLCARGGVEGYNLEHRGSFVSPSYDLEVKTSALGGPLSELLGALNADFNKNTQKEFPHKGARLNC